MLVIRQDPDDRFLRQFAAGALVFFGLIGLARVTSHDDWTTATILWTVGGSLGLTGLISPRFAKPVYMVWMHLLTPIAWVLTFVLLAAIYWLVLTPIGYWYRWRHGDPLQRKLHPQAETYWIERPVQSVPETYLRQF